MFFLKSLISFLCLKGKILHYESCVLHATANIANVFFLMFLQEQICESWGPNSKAKKDSRFENEVLAVLPWYINLIVYQDSLKKQGAVAKRILLQSISF